MWFALSVGGMVFIAALRLLQKAFFENSRMNAFRINWLAFAFQLPLMLGIIAANLTFIGHLQLSFWLTLTAVVVGFYPLTNYLFFKVISQSELSLILPLQGLTPILAAVFGWLLLNQTPAWLPVAGIIFISASIYALGEEADRSAWYAPLKALGSSGSARAMFVISLATAVAALGDKFAIERSSISVYMALNCTGAFVVFLICDILASRKSSETPWRKQLSKLGGRGWWLLAALGLAQLGAQIFGISAVKFNNDTSYVIAIRNLNIVVASMAAVLLFGERLDRFKLWSYGLSALGVVLIAL